MSCIATKFSIGVMSTTNVYGLSNKESKFLSLHHYNLRLLVKLY